LSETEGGFVYDDEQISVSLNGETLQAEKIVFKDKTAQTVDLSAIAQYIVLYKNVRSHLPATI
jgi:hypothetical protein